MLLFVCSVIDHRWRQNMVRTKKWHTRRQLSVSLMFLPHSDVFCDLLLNRRTATWNLFVLYNKQANYHRKSFFISKSFNMTRKPAFVHSAHFDKSWRNLLSIQMKQSHWFLCVAKESWLVQENHVTVKLDSSVASREMQTYRESRIELRNLQILKKILVSFRHQSSPVSAKRLNVALNIAGV